MTGTKERKNILLVSFDDCIAYHHYRTAFGVALQTPNLDRITTRSASFRNAYCQAPICGASRASFMSARAPHHLGIFSHERGVFDVIDPTEIWSYRLKEAGYYCSSGGKVHHGYKALRRRYHNVLYSDEQKRFTDDMSLPQGIAKRRYGGIRGGWGTTDEKDDDTYYDAQSAASAIGFLESYEGDAPFYREVGLFSPHGPRFTPARFKDMYDADAFCRPASWADGFDETPFTAEHMPETPRLVEGDDAWWRANVRNYFAALSHGDYHLGRVWEALKGSRHAENTLVVILSDHGFMLGARNRFYKTTVWEPSAGVPFIFHDPDQGEGRAIDDPVALLDVGPTLLDYAGLPPLAATEGRSLMPQIGGGASPDRAVPTVRYDSASVRKGAYRFIRYADGSTQLFDVAADFWNLHDLGPDHTAYAGMHRTLIECCAAYGLTLPEPGDISLPA